MGRSTRHAFAYLTFRPGKVLSEVAEKRLGAIREFAEFGSGFKIAMRDLEIRGAGNLLGAEQSGHMMSVGYDMYLKLLEEAVLEERGERTDQAVECTADLAIAANIPKAYVSSGEQRMDLYRPHGGRTHPGRLRRSALRAGGPLRRPAKSVLNLLDTALLRAAASKAGIRDISQKNSQIHFTLGLLNFEAVSAVCADPYNRGRVYLAAGNTPVLMLKLKPDEKPLKAAREFGRRIWKNCRKQPEF